MSTSADYDLKERVRAAVDILDVIGQGTEVRPQGRNFVVRCPFHNDRRPSLTINPERQSWKCWVCDIGGDVFSYVMQRDGVDFPTALRTLAEQAGIAMEEFRRGKKTKPGDPDDRATLFDAIAAVADAYYKHLEHGKGDQVDLARQYLDQRGISDESRRRFRIGFAPDQWSFAIDHLQQKNFSGAVAEAAGVAIARGSGNGHYDRFRGRLIFPIHDLQDRPISMGGRIIPAIAQRGENSEAAKYINGPETLLFRKSQQLYGLQLARDAIRHGGEVLVMEGYTDVVAARQAGIEPVVAVLGTALGEAHVRILKRFAHRVVLVLDGDDAGQRRADQVLELFVGAGVDLRVLTLPDGADPADFIHQNGADAFNELVKQSPDAFDHKLAKLSEGVDWRKDTHAASTAMESVLGIMAKSSGDDIRHEQLIVRLSDASGIAVDRIQRRLDVLRSERSQNSRKPFATKRPSRPTPPPRPAATGAADLDVNAMLNSMADDDDESPSPYAPAVIAGRSAATSNARLTPISGIDRELFEALIECPELAGMAVEAIDPSWLSSNTAQMLLSAYQDLDLAGRDLDVDSLLLMVDNEQLKNQIVTLQHRVGLRSGQSSEDADRRYTAIITRYREREFESEKTRQIERLASATLDDDQELALLKELLEAERFRQGIETPTEQEN
ncbi:DNA primase [Crateriforma conspicua]|uniref:DNA primase n=1 Tax=Crateriforma conspicua TaxID=2527996 RepID=A0A5C6FXM4_9PLAN|nr:DNA primase [Crateriforma conspicua]TWU65793.1 DNA primase [Crateriforma conspicua]